MTEVPGYPAEHPDGPPQLEGDPAPAPGAGRSRYLRWILGVAAVAVLVVLHLTGVLGPGGH
ncbi:MAG: hypothetical protein ABJA87_01000 [bacterium]